MKQLRNLRISHGLSQQKLAEQTGLTQQKIHAYEKGINEPDIYTLKLLAKFFDTTVDYLIGNAPEDRKVSGGTCGELSETEAEFLNLFRRISPALRDGIREVMEAYIDK